MTWQVVRTFLANVALHSSSQLPVASMAGGLYRGYGGVQEVPYRQQHLESPALRERLGVPENTSGVAITAVSPVSAAAANASDGSGQLLQADDVIVAIDDHRVGNDHTVVLRGGEIVRADYLITDKPVGQSTSLDVLRGGKARRVSLVLTPLPPPIPRNHAFDSTPEWLLIGGLLFTPLTAGVSPPPRSQHLLGNACCC